MEHKRKTPAEGYAIFLFPCYIKTKFILSYYLCCNHRHPALRTRITVHCGSDSSSLGIPFPSDGLPVLAITLYSSCKQRMRLTFFFAQSFGSVDERRAFTGIPVKRRFAKITVGTEVSNEPFMLPFAGLCLSGFLLWSQFWIAQLCPSVEQNCVCRSIIQGQKTMSVVSWSSVLQTPNRFNKTHFTCSDWCWSGLLYNSSLHSSAVGRFCFFFFYLQVYRKKARMFVFFPPVVMILLFIVILVILADSLIT